MLSLFVVGFVVVFAGVVLSFLSLGCALWRIPSWCSWRWRCGVSGWWLWCWHHRWEWLVGRWRVWLVAIGRSPIGILGLVLGLVLAFALSFGSFVTFGSLLERLGEDVG